MSMWCGGDSVFSVVNQVRSAPRPRSSRATMRLSSCFEHLRGLAPVETARIGGDVVDQREHAGGGVFDQGGAADGGHRAGRLIRFACAVRFGDNGGMNKKAAKDKGKPASGAARRHAEDHRAEQARAPRVPPRGDGSRPAWPCRAGS